MRMEQLILANLLFNDEYLRKVLPFIKKEYFSDEIEKAFFSEISKFVEEYNIAPTSDAVLLLLSENKTLTEEAINKSHQMMKNLVDDFKATASLDWLVNKTEKFCQEKAVYNAVVESICILDDGEKSKLDKGAIPKLLSDALAVSFDNSIGHDYLDNSEQRYDFYHTKEVKVPFDLEFFNKITKDGLSQKTLNIILAGTGVGKSLFMCHMAASCISLGYNVLYITLEMAEERIAERIDANLLNMTLDDLQEIPKDLYLKKIDKLKNNTVGKLIIKEYPTSSASVTHFRSLLNDLQLKRNFAPNIIFVDYLNICTSSRLKQGSNVNSYTYVKSIAEEMRGLAVEYSVPIVSATQTTRSGYANSDPGLEDTSESFGLPATADLMFALVSSEELEEMNQIMVKQLKNRYSDPNKYKRFVIGVDKAKMKLYNVKSDDYIADAGNEEPKTEKPKRSFEGLKV